MTRTRNIIFCVLVFTVAAGALAIRLPRLSLRPMHNDEAVQAYKTGELIDTGAYRYDPEEHHGPTLYYLTLPGVWLSGAASFAETREVHYRIVPVLFSLALFLLLLPLRDALGRFPILVAGVLTAVSPAFVFYNRYYIQETLLVVFTLGAIAAGWRYVRRPRLASAVAAGLCVGLMHATKETTIIAWFSMAVGLAAAWAWSRGDGARRSPLYLPPRRHIAAAVVAAPAVSMLFFSSFGANPRGVFDSVAAYAHSLVRAGGAGMHNHPWHFYLRTLLYTRLGPGPFWSEGLILLLALAGGLAIVTGRPRVSGDRRFLRFLLVYTVTMTVVYAAIPYKTPWCLLGFLHGMILLAGVGAEALLGPLARVAWQWRGVRRAAAGVATVVIAGLLLAGAGHLARQAWRANFIYHSDIRNPYVYAHSVRGVVRLGERVEDIAAFHPAGRDMLVHVIAPGGDYWPVPWYLRRLNRVGYWDHVPPNPDAPVVVCARGLEPELAERMDGEYLVEYHGLRPGVLLATWVRRDLWDAFLQSRMD